MKHSSINVTQPQKITPVEVASVAKLRQLLRKFKAPLDIWGKKLAQKPQQLFNQLRRGKCRLVICEEKLVLLVSVATVYVYRPVTADVWECLFETVRILPNRAVKDYSSPRGIGKKVLPNETPEEAAGRAFTVDLNLKQIPPLYLMTAEHRKEFRPRSSPGLISERREEIFAALAPPEFIQNKKARHTYTNEEGVKTSCEWRPILLKDVPDEVAAELKKRE